MLVCLLLLSLFNSIVIVLLRFNKEPSVECLQSSSLEPNNEFGVNVIRVEDYVLVVKLFPAACSASCSKDGIVRKALGRRIQRRPPCIFRTLVPAIRMLCPVRRPDKHSAIQHAVLTVLVYGL